MPNDYTKIETLPVGTKFYVYNGNWNGEIIEENGERYCLVEETGSKLPLRTLSPSVNEVGDTLGISVITEEEHVERTSFVRKSITEQNFCTQQTQTAHMIFNRNGVG